jgi:sterol desaturase/sphingolipid hydroxylase (fatty acid hydroxylase superfamily)
MAMANSDGFLLEHAEALQYSLFFGLFALCAGLEVVFARRKRTYSRRQRWPANLWLLVLNVLILGALPIGANGAAAFAETHGIGLLNQFELPVAVALAAGLAARSLVSYATHVAMHKVPLLWRLHRVHHLDTVLDVSTTVRFHPLEFLITVPPTLFAVTALGLPLTAVALYELLDVAIAVISHADLRLPATFDRALRLVFVTPGMHLVHHSADPRETDSNYGAVFAWWDWIFRTYRTGPAAPEAVQIGLAEWRDGRVNSLRWLLRSPIGSPSVGPEGTTHRGGRHAQTEETGEAA